MRELSFEIILKKVDEAKYQAICPTLPGCYSEGKTKKEALVKIEKAILDYIEMALDWTASGMMMLKVFNDGDKNPNANPKAPQMFPMEVKLFEDKNAESQLQLQTLPLPMDMPMDALPTDILPATDKGVLGIPFGYN